MQLYCVTFLSGFEGAQFDLKESNLIWKSCSLN